MKWTTKLLNSIFEANWQNQANLSGQLNKVKYAEKTGMFQPHVIQNREKFSFSTFFSEARANFGKRAEKLGLGPAPQSNNFLAVRWFMTVATCSRSQLLFFSKQPSLKFRFFFLEMSCLECKSCYKENLHFIQLRDLLLDTFLFQPLVECATTPRSLNAFGNKLSPKEVRIISMLFKMCF